MENIQGTTLWAQERLGRFTSSEIWKLMTDPKSKADKEAGVLSQTAKTYVLDKIGEKMAGFCPTFDSAATAWGNENEPKAREQYEKATGITVQECGFKLSSFAPYYGGSPDGLIKVEGKNGIIEIKCPYTFHNHLEHCLIEDVDYFKSEFKEYYWQMQSNMLIHDADFGNFISYDPRMANLFVFHVPANHSDFGLIKDRVENARERMIELANKLNVKL